MALAMLCLFGWAMQGRSSQRIVWEYKIITIQDNLKSEAMLNELGQQGWELILHDQQPPGYPASGGNYYLKRSK